MKHRWDKPIRPDLNHTFRTCGKCGIVRITRHEDEHKPRHWTEFERDDGSKLPAKPTPVCEVA
jgi:hypothetical protein